MPLPQLNILVPQVALDPQLRFEAANFARANVGHFLDSLSGEERERKHVRVSDVGRCSLELYAFLHGQLDLPDDGANMIAKLDNGTFFGFWLACLEAVAIQHYMYDRKPGITVRFEFETVLHWHGIVPGHSDLIVYVNDVPVWLIENKSTYTSQPLDPPHLHMPMQPLQAGTYADSKGIPDFSIVVIGPAVQRKWVKSEYGEPGYFIYPEKLSQFDYKTADWVDKVNDEMNRLIDIENADERPREDITASWRPREKGKAVEAWRCRYCRYSQCSRNENPLKALLEALG